MSSRLSGSSVLVVGVGNTQRGDDGIGPAVIAALEARGLPCTQCMICQGDGLQLIEAWKDTDRVVLIDAATSGAPPGTIYRFEARGQTLPAGLRFSSTHAFGVVEAIELARELDLLPPHLVLYAVEGKQFAVGTELSLEVQRALSKVVDRVVWEITDFGLQCTIAQVSHRP